MRAKWAFAAALAVHMVAVGIPAARAGRAPVLLPTPHELHLLSGETRVTRDWSVVWSVAPDDSATATLIADEAERCFGWRPTVRPAPYRGPRIVLATATDTAGATPLEREQGYRLRIDGAGITIAASTTLGRFYGAQTLRQLFRAAHDTALPRLVIRDYPALAWRGVSEDMSRGRIPDAATLDATLEHLAFYKMNLYQPYIESLDQLLADDRHARSDRFGRSDLLALLAAGRRHHIAVCPIVATVSHRPPATGDPDEPDSSWTSWAPEPVVLACVGLRAWLAAYLGPVTPSSAIGAADLARLESNLGDLAKVCPGPFLHLGGDEWIPAGGVSDTAGLAYGRAMARLVTTVRRSGRLTPMLYADVIKTYSGAGELLPRDVALVDWDYFGLHPDGSLDSLGAIGFRNVFPSPGIWNWSTFYPNHARAFADIASLADAARRRGLPGCITASWGDGGGECLAENSWVGFAYAAAATWGDASPESNAFLDTFVATEFGVPSPGLALAIHALGWREFSGYANSGRLMFRPLVVRTASSQWRDEMRTLATDMTAAGLATDTEASRARFAPDEIRAMRHAIARYAYIARRELMLDSLGRVIAAAPGARLPEIGRDQVVHDLCAMGDEAARLKAEYHGLWLGHNRPEGLTTVEARFTRQVTMTGRLARLAQNGQLAVDDSYQGLQAMREESPEPR
jgi:hypothetical protein